MVTVELINVMGSDLTIVNAARVSFNKEHKEFDEEKDERLIRYLSKHNHWTPFSHVMFQFRIKMPIFVARQWYRHTVGFARNEVSRRYVDATPEFYRPQLWRARAEDKKQGSHEYENIHTLKNWIDRTSPNDKMKVSNAYDKFIRWAEIFYNELITSDVAPEQARMVLPQSVMTEFIETASLYAYARLYNLRAKPDAQEEIREYAEAIGKRVKEQCPVSWKYLTDV